MPRKPAALTLSVAFSTAAFAILSCVPRAPLSLTTATLHQLDSAETSWPGFTLRDRNWLIFTDQEAWLVTAESPPPGFVPVHDAVAGSRRIYHARTKLPGLTDSYVRDYRLGSLSVLAVPLEESLRSTVGTLYHEAFHDYQAASFVRRAFDADGGWRVQSRTFTTDFAIAVELERRILRAALRPLSRVTEDSVVRIFLAVRDDRWRGVDSFVVAYERRSERGEGSAQYVDLVSTVAWPDRSGTVAPRERVALLLGVPLRVHSGSPANRLLWHRSYATGAAIALLLDRRRPDWKGEVERGQSLDSVLRTTLTDSVMPVPVALSMARSRFGAARLASTTNPPWGSLAPAFMPGDVANLPGFHVRVEFDVPSRVRFGSNTRGDAKDGVFIDSTGMSAMIKTSFLTVTDTSQRAVDVSVRTHPVTWSWFGPDSNQVAIRVVLPTAPQVVSPTGRQLESGTFAQLDLRGRDFVLRASTGAVVVAWRDSALVRIPAVPERR